MTFRLSRALFSSRLFNAVRAQFLASAAMENCVPRNNSDHTSRQLTAAFSGAPRIVHTESAECFAVVCCSDIMLYT